MDAMALLVGTFWGLEKLQPRPYLS